MFNFKNLTAAGIVAIASFLFFALVLPQYISIQNINKAVSEHNEVLNQKKELLLKINSLEEQYTSRTEDIDKLSTILPQRKNIEETLSSIEDISRQSGLSLNRIVASVRERVTTDLGESVGILSVETNFSGLYPSFFTFLTLLEKNIRVFDIQGFSMVKESFESDILSFKVSIETYFIK